MFICMYMFFLFNIFVNLAKLHVVAQTFHVSILGTLVRVFHLPGIPSSKFSLVLPTWPTPTHPSNHNSLVTSSGKPSLTAMCKPPLLPIVLWVPGAQTPLVARLTGLFTPVRLVSGLLSPKTQCLAQGLVTRWCSVNIE